MEYKISLKSVLEFLSGEQGRTDVELKDISYYIEDVPVETLEDIIKSLIKNKYAEQVAGPQSRSIRLTKSGEQQLEALRNGKYLLDYL